MGWCTAGRGRAGWWPCWQRWPPWPYSPDAPPCRSPPARHGRLPRSGVLERRRHQQRPVRHGARQGQQSGESHPGPLPARRSEPRDKAPGARVGARRQLHRGGQDQRGARGRGQQLRQARIRGGVDQLPPERPAHVRGQPVSAGLRPRRIRRPARRPGGRPLATRKRRHLRDRHDADRHRRRVRGRDHRHAWWACVPTIPARAAIPGRRPQLGDSSRCPAACRAACSPTRQPLRACSSTARPTTPSRSNGPGLRRHGSFSSACPRGSRSRTAPATCPGRSTASLYLAQSTWFLFYMLDLAHAQGQTTSTARAVDSQVRKLEAKYPTLSLSH